MDSLASRERRGEERRGEESPPEIEIFSDTLRILIYIYIYIY